MSATKRNTRETTVHSQEALLDTCRRDPRILNAIQELLTDEQLQSLFREISDQPTDDPGTTEFDNDMDDSNA